MGHARNPHAVALGRLGGLVRSDAKRQGNRENVRKGGSVKSRRRLWRRAAMHVDRVLDVGRARE